MDRFDYRSNYIAAWYELDECKLVSSCAKEFIFDDPAEPALVYREELPSYMHRWQARVIAQTSDAQWKLEHESRLDKNGILTDWEWWEVLGTDLKGMAVVLTGDRGVILERITYFQRK